MDENYTLYLHINKINKKKYVGITSQKPETRWGNNGCGYKGQLFYNAIVKYGWDGFEHIILKENLSEKMALWLEHKCIKHYKSLINQNGYNVAEYGSLNKFRTIFVYDFITLNYVNSYKNVNYAAKSLGVKPYTISACCRGESMGVSEHLYYSYKNYGKRLPVEISNKIKKYNFYNNNGNFILKYDLEGNYISTYNSALSVIKENGLKSGFSYNTVSCGFIWINCDTYEKYINIKDKLSIEEMTKYTKYALYEVPCHKYDFNGRYLMTYNSLKEAANDVGLKNYDTIIDACQKKIMTSMGYIWRFAYEFKRNENLPLNEIPDVHNVTFTRKVDMYNLNGDFIKMFDSPTSAAKFCNASTSNICSVCNGKSFKCKGYIFKYHEHKLTENDIYNANKKYNSKLKKKVKQMTLDGNLIREYESISEAAKAIGKGREGIRDCCNGKQSTAYGFKWKTIV